MHLSWYLTPIVFRLQYLNYISLVKGRYNIPFLIHSAVNFQLMITVKVISMMKRGNSHMADVSGARVTFPWLTSDWSHSCGGQLHMSYIPLYTVGTCFFFLNIYSFLREREGGRETESEWAWAGEGQRERDRGSKTGSAGTAVSPAWGLNSQTMRSWPEPKSDTQPTEPPCQHLF